MPCSVEPVPALLIERFEKVATPLTALTVFVPARVQPPACVPIATVTAPANEVTTIPFVSSADTCTAGMIGWPACVDVGCVVNANCVACGGGGDGGAAVMTNVWLVALVSPERVAWSV